MAVLKIVGLIAAILFCLWAFFKVFQFIVRSWRAIEAEEEDLRQARLRAITRSGYEIQ
jgi:hypothetical protein